MVSSDTFWVALSNLIAVIGFFASSFFGILLILLNTFVVKRVNPIYKYLMNVFTCQGILFATLEFALVPNLLSYNAGYMFFLLKQPFGFDKKICQILLAIYSGLLCSTMTMLAVQFLYRYWLVFDTSKIEYFNGWKILLWFGYSVIFGLIWIIGLCLVEFPTEETMLYFKKETFHHFQKHIETLPALIMMPYLPDGSIRWSAWGLTLSQCIITSIQYVIMAYCGWSMHTKLEKSIVTMSKQSKLLHQQFFRVLVIQISAPTVFLLIPFSFIVYLPFFNLEISANTGALLCSFTLYNAIDSIIVMTVVSEYRKSSRKFLIDLLQKFQNWLKVDNPEIEMKTTTVGQVPDF